MYVNHCPDSVSNRVKFFRAGLYLLLLLPILGFASIRPDSRRAENISAAHDTLRTIVVNDYYPYTFVNAQGQPAGFSVDLMQAVAQVMGFQVEIRVDTWDHALQALQAGDIDFLPMMAFSSERDKSFDFSAPHTIAYDAFFTRKDASAIRSMDDLRGKTIIVMNGDQAHDYLRSIPSIKAEQFILVDSLPQALRLLASGTGDAALMPKLVGFLLMRDLSLTNLELSPVVVEAYSRPFSFAVREGNQVLLERLSQGLSIVKATGKYHDLYYEWFGAVEPQGLSVTTVLQYIGGIVLVFTLTGATLLAWSFSLRKQVTVRTRSLELEIHERKRAEAEILRRIEQIAALNDAALKIQQHLDPDQIYRTACEELRRFGAFASVFKVNDDGGLQHIHSSMNDEFLASYIARFGDRAFNFVLPLSVLPDAEEKLLSRVNMLNSERLPMLLEKAPPEIRQLIAWVNVQSSQAPVLLAPLTRDEKTVGLFAVVGKSLSEIDIPAVALFVRQVSSALENAELFTAEQARRGELVALYDLARALVNADDLAEALALIVRHAVETIHVTFARIALLENDELVIRAAHPVRSLDRDLRVGYRGLVSQYKLCRRVLVEGDPVIVNVDDAALNSFDRQILFLDFAKSACLVTLRAGDTPLGLLILSEGRDPTREPFTIEKIHLARAIGDQAASAIRRAALRAQTVRDAIELARAYDATLEGWSRALDLRDNETEGHTQRVTEMTVRLARLSGFDDEQLVHIRRGALLHDIGKMGISDAILLKPGPLTDHEWEIMRRHADYAQMLLAPIEYLTSALDIPYCHHEKWDGTGYPRGLKGETIPLVARLFAVVDVWDAMTSKRPYRDALPPDRVREHIRAHRGTHFDPQVVELFLKTIESD